MRITPVLILMLLNGPWALFLQGQSNYWQQAVAYTLVVDMDVEKNQYQGRETLVYHNNSPDTLRKVFFHLYPNAFRPGSSMDVRSVTSPDPDPRVMDRISKLRPEEQGWLEVTEMTIGGKPVRMTSTETILEVGLDQPILPQTKVQFELAFKGQVPIQIRRSGRDNAEGVRYSMSQWYPKICAYDFYGWHANPYIGREFYGEWGTFDVTISIDETYTVAGTGTLKNTNEVGHGYENTGTAVPKGKGKLQWNFRADQVHDFVWAADPNYVHKRFKPAGGPELHFFYQIDSLTEAWALLPEYVGKAFKIMTERYGPYPYDHYSVIQGGDGGMEYPMATLITGRRALNSLVSVSVHELVHSWFQGMLATNEALYAWMDEGFTQFATHEIMAELFPGPASNPHSGSFDSYLSVVEAGMQEPLCTHADHYISNHTYGSNAYNKGALLLHQLSYIVGRRVFDEGMRRYCDVWRFKHPTPTDFMRSMEKSSGLELDWFFEYWLNSIHTIDYGIRSVKKTRGGAVVALSRLEPMPMPLDILITYEDGSRELHYIPLELMRGEKVHEGDMPRIVHPDWHWVQPVYEMQLQRDVNDIVKIELDPSMRLADTQRDNNAMDAATIKARPWEQWEKED